MSYPNWHVMHRIDSLELLISNFNISTFVFLIYNPFTLASSHPVVRTLLRVLGISFYFNLDIIFFPFVG